MKIPSDVDYLMKSSHTGNWGIHRVAEWWIGRTGVRDDQSSFQLWTSSVLPPRHPPRGFSFALVCQRQAATQILTAKSVNTLFSCKWTTRHLHCSSCSDEADSSDTCVFSNFTRTLFWKISSDSTTTVVSCCVKAVITLTMLPAGQSFTWEYI